jgi:hypothetical protein
VFPIRLELHFKHCADEPSAPTLNLTAWVVLNWPSALHLNFLVPRCVGTTLCLSSVVRHTEDSSKSLQRLVLLHIVHFRPNLGGNTHSSMRKNAKWKRCMELTKSYPLIAAKLTKLWVTWMRNLVAVILLSVSNDYDL